MLLKAIDLIEVMKIKKLTVIDGSLQSKERDVPEYIQLDDKNKTAKLVRVPKFAEVPFPVVMEPNLNRILFKIILIETFRKSDIY